MTNTRRILILTMLVTANVGCMTANTRPEVAFSGSWAADPAKDRAMKARLEERVEVFLGAEAPREVEVFVGSIPAGFEVSGEVFQIVPGAPFEILGRAVIAANPGTSFGFADYEDGWRKGYCWWQAPLTWVTLAIWAAVPVNYPCGVSPSRDKVELLSFAKNLVHDLGGHMLIGGYIGESEDSAMGLQGFVIRKLEVATPQEVTPTGAAPTEL